MPRSALIVLALGLVARVALAQGIAPEAKSGAAALLQEGIDLYGAGHYEDALARFESAYALVPSPKIFLNMGYVLRKLDRDPEAATAYARFLVETTGRADVGEQMRRAAEGELRELGQRIGRIRLAPALAPDETVLLDGRPATAVSYSLLYAWPGAHRVSLRTGQRISAEAHVEVTAGGEETVRLELAPPPILTPVVTQEPPPRPVAPREGTHLWSYVLAASGVALTATGAVLSVTAGQRYDELHNDCMTRACTMADWNGPATRERIGDGLLIAGGAGVVGGVVLWLLDRHGAASAPRAFLAPTLGGIVARASFP